DGIRDFHVTGVQTCALPIFLKEIENDIYGILASDEQEFIKNKRPWLWDKWLMWRKFFIIPTDTAPELIFSSSFSSSPQIFLHGRSEERRVGKDSSSLLSTEA